MEVVEHRAHAPGHAALLVVDYGVLVAGDMLSDVEIPLPDLEAEDPLGDYAETLDLFEDLLDAGRVAALVPGHGSVGDRVEARQRVEEDRRYIDGMLANQPVDDRRLAGADPWLLREHSATVRMANRRRRG